MDIDDEFIKKTARAYAEATEQILEDKQAVKGLLSPYPLVKIPLWYRVIGRVGPILEMLGNLALVALAVRFWIR